MKLIEVNKEMEAQLDVQRSCIDGSKFVNVSLSKAYFEDVNLAGTKITNANLSDLEIEGAQLGGAYIHNVGVAPKGHPMHDPDAKQRSLKFEDCDLSGSVITNCNLSGVDINDCNLKGVQISDCNLSGVQISDSNFTGMKINGYLVTDLLKAIEGIK